MILTNTAGLEKLLESQRRFAIANEEALPMAVHKLGRRDADFHETNMAISDSSAEVVALVLDNGSISAETQSLVPKDVVSITSIPIS